MKLQHTPGPWGRSNMRHGLGDNGGLSVDAIDPIDNATFEVCEVWGLDDDDVHDDRSIANARLIAAAPEMLDALLREYELFKNIYDMGLLMLGTQMQEIEIFERALEIKKSAIERATGMTIDEVLEAQS